MLPELPFELAGENLNSLSELWLTLPVKRVPLVSTNVKLEPLRVYLPVDLAVLPPATVTMANVPSALIGKANAVLVEVEADHFPTREVVRVVGVEVVGVLL